VSVFLRRTFLNSLSFWNSFLATAQKMLPGAAMKPSSSANINDLFQLLGVQQANLQKDLRFEAART
jgi:hypothetical protein